MKNCLQMSVGRNSEFPNFSRRHLYLDFAERKAERHEFMTMSDWASHLDNVLTMNGEQLLVGPGSVSHEQAVGKATEEYKKYQQRTLSDVEKAYLDTIKLLESKTKS